MIALRPSRRRPPSSVRLSFLLLVIVLVTLLWPATHALAQSTEADVYVAQAVLEYSEGKYDEALANLRKALETEPDHVEALYLTGVVLMAKDQPAKATPFLEKARARSRTDPAIAFQLGLAYFAQQQYDRAQPLLEEAFRSQPTLDGLAYYVGFLRYRKKDYRGALDALRAGRTTKADLQQLTKFYSGLALGVLGLPGQAAAEIDQAIRAAPASAFTGPAERLRDSMVAARQGQRRLSAEVRLGFFYDDNVAVIPNADSSEPLVAALRRVKATSSGELFGLRAGYAWLKIDQWEAKLGYQFDWDDAVGRNYEYVGNRILAGGQYTLPWLAIRLKYDLDVHLRNYQHNNSLLPTTAPGTTQRQDQEITNIVRAELPLPYSFTLVAEYQRTMNISNIAVFDYTRNVSTLMLSWSY